MNRYDSYKDSGVEWIGKIPSHWDFVRLKYLFSLEGGKDPKNIQNDEGEYPILGTGGEISRGSDYLYDKPTLLLGRKGTIDKPYLYESPFWVSDVMYYTIMKKDITPKYLHFLFKTIPFDYYRYGSTQPSMSRLDYESMYFPIPPSDERQEVSNYLDTKTSLIDSLIEKTKQKIELLKEKRTSLINEVVTKGLNPNVEMKDSGVEWIGEIPSGWKYGKVKFFMEYKKGYPFKSENMSDEGLPIIKVTSIKKLKINTPKTFFKGEFDDRITIVKEGDIIITTVGSKHEVSNSSVGQLGLVEKDQNGFLLNQNTVSIRTKFNSVVNNKFIFNYFQSKKFRNYLDIHSHGTVNQSSLNVDDILNFNLPYPPLSEQQQIVEYLDEQTGLIDKTISIEEKRIELLKEYRQSLISEVVTGKRKVTN